MRNFVLRNFRVIKCCTEKHQSSVLSLTIIFHSVIRHGGNTVEETVYHNSTFNYASDPCDFNGECIFPRLRFFHD